VFTDAQLDIMLISQLTYLNVCRHVLQIGMQITALEQGYVFKHVLPIRAYLEIQLLEKIYALACAQLGCLEIQLALEFVIPHAQQFILLKMTLIDFASQFARTILMVQAMSVFRILILVQQDITEMIQRIYV
jgi:hypothetical protein